MTSANKNVCREEYIALLDYLRVNYSPDFNLSETSSDLVDFLMGLELFQTHEHLLYLFRFCCLCLTSPSRQYPSVLFGSVDTAEFCSRFTNVLMPCQSYLSCVPDSVSSCITEVDLEKFLLLSASFERSAFSAEYDPWAHVDTFDRSKIYKGLLALYKEVVAVPSTRSVRLEKEGALSIQMNPLCGFILKLRGKDRAVPVQAFHRPLRSLFRGLLKD